MARYATVDEYIGALPERLREVASRTRRILDESFASAGASAIRWAHPTWSVGNEPVCYLKMATPRHLTFGFWKGASIRDRSGRLESSGEVMAHAKLRSVDDVDPALFSDWVRQAMALTGGGVDRHSSRRDRPGHALRPSRDAAPDERPATIG
jgi:hypothetical protein